MLSRALLTTTTTTTTTAAAAATHRASSLSSTVFARRRMLSTKPTLPSAHETITTEVRDDGVAVLTLHRPKALNALNDTLMEEVCHALECFDADERVGCTVLTGSARAFAAGADIKMMASLDFMKLYKDELFARWDSVRARKKPIIAAVSGYALGGGCEVAMMADIVYASESARFGQPEITLGTIPGIGGTQRLTRAVGKYKAMEMVLGATTLTAAEAERAGLVARVFADDELMPATLAMAAKIASFSTPVAMMAKEAVNAALETTLAEGVHFERRLFMQTFATADRAEGMAAFVEKRKPDFKNE